jgi:hypothetical protein
LQTTVYFDKETNDSLLPPSIATTHHHYEPYDVILQNAHISRKLVN